MKDNRRNFIKKMGAISALSVLPTSTIFASDYQIWENGKKLPTPTRAQQKWQDAEVGMLFHFDISIATGLTSMGNNTNRKLLDPQKYDPSKLDTDQWIAVAKSAGAKYAIFTATHFQGFMQWQSDLYPYGLKQAKWRNGKGDIIKDFVESCRKADILPGIYFSTHRNVYWEVWDHYVNWGKGKGTPAQAKFNRVAEGMATELFSKYGPLLQIWMDAGVKLPDEGGPDLLPLFDRYQPESIFYNSTKRSDYRWIGNEKGYADYPCWATMPDSEKGISSELWKPILGSGDPDGEIWSPGMVDVPVRGSNGIHNWFWREGQETGLDSTEKLVEMYCDSVGRNCNLVLGEVITPEGLVPEADVKRMAEFGAEIKRRFSDPIASISGTGEKINLKLPRSQKVNQIILMEDISKGERVRKFILQRKTENGWKTIFEGSCIGHKFIHRFDEIEVPQLRLVITESVAEPIIKEFVVYNSVEH